MRTLALIEVAHVLRSSHEGKGHASKAVNASGLLTETEHGFIATFVGCVTSVADGSLSGDPPELPFFLDDVQSIRKAQARGGRGCRLQEGKRVNVLKMHKALNPMLLATVPSSFRWRHFASSSANTHAPVSGDLSSIFECDFCL